jgi:hypothetical protein
MKNIIKIGILLIVIAAMIIDTSITLPCLLIMLVLTFALEERKIGLEKRLVFIIPTPKGTSKYIANDTKQLEEVKRKIKKEKKININNLYMEEDTIFHEQETIYFKPRSNQGAAGMKFKIYYKYFIQPLKMGTPRGKKWNQ